MTVIFYQLKQGPDRVAADQVVGTLTLRGRKIVADPRDSLALSRVLQTPVFERGTGKQIRATDDPVRFLVNLRWNYRGAYFRASAPQVRRGSPRPAGG